MATQALADHEATEDSAATASDQAGERLPRVFDPGLKFGVGFPPCQQEEVVVVPRLLDLAQLLVHLAEPIGGRGVVQAVRHAFDE